MIFMNKISTDPQKIKELLERGVEEVIVKADLEKKLKSGKQLRVKLGIDPTGSDLHIGHAVVLRKLRQFQECGHQAILLIGDYTAMIGDPSGRNETRPLLKPEQVKENMKTYLKQAGKVVDLTAVEVRYNSEWYGRSNSMKFFMDLTGRITIARILDREDFKKRLKADEDIRMQEILYPVLQGYDSVALQADVELGGNDQKLNLLMGRRVQRAYGQAEQNVMTVSLLIGTDGEKKMSKTYGNFIGLLDSPENIFGKTMSIPDNLIIRYFELATSVPADQISGYQQALATGANPRDVKMKLAEMLVAELSGEDKVTAARRRFVAITQDKKKPAEIPEIKPSAYDIVTVLVEGKLADSKSEARRAIEQGGVKVNDVKAASIGLKVNRGSVVQKGKRFFIKVS